MANDETPKSGAAQSALARDLKENDAKRLAAMVDLLQGDAQGLILRGRVTAVSPDRALSGTTAKGKPYAFTIRNTNVLAGGDFFQLREMWNPGDEAPEKLPIASEVAIRVRTAKMNGPVIEVSGEDLDELL